MEPMEVLRRCVLLAVLLEVALCSDDECTRRTHCEVTGVREEVVTMECGDDIRQSKDEWNTSENNLSSTKAYTVEDYNSTYNESIVEHYIFAHSSQDDGLANVSDSRHTKEKDNMGTDLISNNDTDWLNEQEENRVYESIGKKNLRIDQEYNLKNVSILKVYLLKNSSTLDLVSYPNVNTMLLFTCGHTLDRICNAHNVTSLSCKSLMLDNMLFIRNMSGLKTLNLSDNGIQLFPISELPKSIVLLDLSHNNIIFNTSINLPSSLKLLNVSYNNLSNVDGVIMRGNLEVLDLRGNMLNRIPSLDICTLEELNLSRNLITTLENGVFVNLSSLTVLDLKKNRLNSLGEEVFNGLNKLQWLDMSENNIMSLGPATFQFLNNLVTISLSENRNLGSLQDVEDSSFLFGTGQRLQVIEASGTNLTRIPSTLTRSVRKLFLVDNAISSVQCGELDSFPLLQVIDISKNIISEIEEDALGRLEFLSHLLLSSNKLTDIPKSLPNQLEIFDLRCNEIGKLNNNDFLGLQKLRVLLLSKNNISIIEDGSFGQLTSLEVLDLSHNPIKSLSRTSFVGPRRLKEIYLMALRDLIPLQEPLSFPAPESAHLEVLNMESSPVLATQLMDDVAALTMFHELFELNLNHCRLSTLRSDLPEYLPRLHKLDLSGNALNCTNIIWLVKWLQALNISMQDSEKFRREIYNLKHICCEDSDDANSNDGANVMCASPEHLSGKQIISLKEEDFPDLKLTSSALPLAKQLSITEPYLALTLADSESNTSSRVSGRIDPSITTLPIYNRNSSSPAQLLYIESSTRNIYQAHNQPLTEVAVNNGTSEDILTVVRSNINETKPMKTAKLVNHLTQKWKYVKSERTWSQEAVVVLLNRTTYPRDYDNQQNESSRLGTFLAHETPTTSHPGMLVFLLVVGLILVASSVMMYSQCSQTRRLRAYRQQQDIEVSSLGGLDLW